MSEKRKDKNGRILQKGESQRKDGVYQYRYNDSKGKRQTIYAGTLAELRDKEREIQKIIDRGGDYAAGNITVEELLNKYINLKSNIRVRTLQSYTTSINAINKTSLAKQKIKDVKISTVKAWCKELYDSGTKYNTISGYRTILKPAFQMAYEEDVIFKNPFDFPLNTVISNNAEERIALTMEQQKNLLEFLRTDAVLYKYYDEIIVFLCTGARVSEICGLTIDDIDFEQRIINIRKQLFCDNKGKYYTSALKTNAGERKIPMDDILYSSFKRLLQNRKCKNEVIVDGYGGFIFIGNRGAPRVSHHYNRIMKTIIKKYNEKYDTPLPPITPHVLRHTYCTNLINSGIDVKSMQYLMGHANVKTTLGIYTHNEYEDVLQRISNVVAFQKAKKMV